LKPISFIPPVVALVIAGGWIGAQRQSISTLEKESDLLRKHIAARASGAGADSPPARSAAPGKEVKDKPPLDWKKIAAQFAEMQRSGGMGDMRTMMRFQQRLQAMTKEELVSALDEIAALDLPAESRAMLEQMLIGPLVQKDPELALTRFIDRIQDQQGGMSWQLSSALQEWAEKDPARASAWFDQQIAAGKFDSKSLDGKSRSRQQFEGALINVLLASNPDAAANRLGAIPEDQRSDVLSQYQFQQLKEEDQLAFAKLVRSQVPEGERANTLAQQASWMVSNDGYSKVTEYLNRIEATPAERAECAEEAAESKLRNYNGKKVTREDLDAMREWVGSQAPEALGRTTGKALGNALQGNHKMEFSEAADLAVEYNQAGGNDEVLASFLESWPARQNKEQARALAEKIADGKRREEILKYLK
jgi:hypothetical protein